MKRKVLFLIDSLTCGGAEKSLISLLPLIDYTKCEVDLMMVNRGGVFEQFVPKEVRIVTFPEQRGLLFKLCQVVFSVLLRMFPSRHGAELRWMAMGKAYKGVKKEYDVAIAYQQGFPTYYVVEKVKANKKIAWVNVNIFNAGYNAKYNARYYDMLDNIVPVSEDLLSIMKENYHQYNCKYVCVYDILNLNVIRQYAQNQVEDCKCQDGITLTTTGRMVYQKNYPLAVETARLLRDSGLTFKWNFVGDGGERADVEDLVKKYQLKDSIILWGMQPNPYPYMDSCDIYVQCSRFEGFGLTIAEAKILGKPVVSTNFDVVHDQLIHEHNGLIAEMTPESLAENILRLVNDTALREKIIANVKSEENMTAQTEARKVMKMILEP